MKEFLVILFRRKWYAVTFFICVVTGSMTLAYILPPKYESTSSLIITAGREKKPFLPNEKDSRVGFIQVTMEDVGSEVELLTSYPVIAAAVDENGLDVERIPSKKDGMKYYIYSFRKLLKNFLIGVGLKVKVPFREESIMQLMEDIEIEYITRTNIISVSYRGGTPQLAQNVVNSVVKAYQEHHINVFGYGYALDTVKNSMDESYKKLMQKEDQLHNYLDQKGISNIEQEREMLLSKLTEAENKFNVMKSLMAKEKDKEIGNAEIGLISGDPAFFDISNKITSAEMKRIELLGTYGERDRTVKAVDMEIRELHALLGKMLKNNLSNWEKLILFYKKRLRDLDNAKNEIDILKREIENLSQEYFLNKEKYNELFIASNLDKAKLSSVRIIAPASLSNTPAFPKKIIILVVSIFFGFFGGIACAFGIHKFSGRITSVAELQSFSEIPVIASIPQYGNMYFKDSNLLANQLDKELLLAKKTISAAGEKGTSILLVSPTSENGTTFMAESLARLSLRSQQTSVILLSIKYVKEISGDNTGDDFFASDKSAIEFITSKKSENYDRLTINIFPDEVLISEKKIKKLFDDLKNRYKFFIIDMPSQRDGMFYLDFIPFVDFVFVVIGYENVTRHQLLQMVDLVRQQNRPISGFIFNRRRNPIPDFIYKRYF